MKVIRLALLLVLGLLVLSPSIAIAATSVQVVITATPGAAGGISNFLITYISDTQLDLNWGFYGDAVNIMIRGKYGDYPADIPDENTTPSDGYLVYYGNAVSASDTTMDFDTNAGPIYYKVWAQKADGKWYTGAITGIKESEVMTLLAFIILTGGLTIATFALQSGRRILCWVSAGSWLLLGIYSYTKYVTVWDIYYALFMLSMIMVLVCALVQAVLREKKEAEPDMLEGFDESDRPLAEDIMKTEKDRDNYNRLFGRRKIGDKTLRVKRPRYFAKTGRIK